MPRLRRQPNYRHLYHYARDRQLGMGVHGPATRRFYRGYRDGALTALGAFRHPRMPRGRRPRRVYRRPSAAALRDGMFNSKR